MKKKEKLLLLTTSTILFVFAFITAYIPFQLSSYFLAKIFAISTNISNFKVIYITDNNSVLWNNLSIISLYGIPPILSFVLANISRKIYDSARKRKSNYKLFLSWLNLHFDNLFWGSIIAGIFTSSGFAYFLNWMYIPYFVQIIIAVLGLVLFFSLNNFSLQSFIQSSPARIFINKENQLKYKTYVIYFPLLLGSVFLIAISFPHFLLHERIINITLLVPLITTAKYFDEENVKLVKNSLTFKPNLGLIVLIILYLLLFQFI
jgi:hypothetical protein